MFTTCFYCTRAAVHRCSGPGEGSQKCGKPICEVHSREWNDRWRCEPLPTVPALANVSVSEDDGERD